LPVEDEETVAELRKAWDGNHENSTVYFTVQKACGKEKLISARFK